jgi:hypothetical protein
MLLAIPTLLLRGAPAAPTLSRSLSPPRRRCSRPAQTSASTAIIRVIRALVPITLLTEHVTRCKLFETEATGEPEQVAFDAESDTPLATAKFR